MQSCHRIFFKPAASLAEIDSGSVDLVVTSPPYPMIQMWDESFALQDARIRKALFQNDGRRAFTLMHRLLAGVWAELYRVLRAGGIACINIGDATRTINGRFALYANHAQILAAMQEIGFGALPAVLWRKPTNAPNKFMGSGMMPPGAYVTLEHEYILIFRKGGKREFQDAAEKRLRKESAYFWEERNTWFSDVWMELRGARQELGDGLARQRSAAFPFELPYRLISMFSVKGDRVLDPFLGAGTTMLAAMAAGRHSIGYEIDETLNALPFANLDAFPDVANQRIQKRLDDHRHFVQDRQAQKGPLKYVSRHYGFPVVTRQEIDILLDQVRSVSRRSDREVEVLYTDVPVAADPTPTDKGPAGTGPSRPRTGRPPAQRPLFK